MAKELVVGLLPSVRFDLLKRCVLSLVNQRSSFPVIVLAQGYSQAQKDELERMNPGFLHFIYREKIDKPIGYFRSELFKLAPEAEFFYLFDDDIVFDDGGVSDILEIVNTAIFSPLIGAIYLNEVGDLFNIGRLYDQLLHKSGHSFYRCKKISSVGTRSGILVRTKAFYDALGTLDPTIAACEEAYIATYLFAWGYDVLKAHARIKHLHDTESFGAQALDMLNYLDRLGKEVVMPNGGKCAIRNLIKSGFWTASGNEVFSPKVYGLRYEKRTGLLTKFSKENVGIKYIPKEIDFQGKKLVFIEGPITMDYGEEALIAIDLSTEFCDSDLEKIPVVVHRIHSKEHEYLVRKNNVVVGNVNELDMNVHIGAVSIC